MIFFILDLQSCVTGRLFCVIEKNLYYLLFISFFFIRGDFEMKIAQ